MTDPPVLEVAIPLAEFTRLHAEVERLTLADRQWADHVKRLADERDRLQARLCYVNPDGSHVRGCAQHEAQHPAQWCESLARANCG